MAWLTKKRLKYALAGVGAVYAVLFTGYIVLAMLHKPASHGPSELELHPERQAEIVSQQQAQELKDRLKLSDEQAKQVADIMQKNQPDPNGDQQGRWRGMQDEIAKVLTPEQKAQAEQLRSQFRGRGNLSPERIEALEQHMSPQLRSRFDARMKQMEQRRSQRGGRGGGPGGFGGPPPGAPQGPESQPPPPPPAASAPQAPPAQQTPPARQTPSQ